PAARLRRRHTRHHPAQVPGNPRPDHHHSRRGHRPARTPRLLTRPPQGGPATRHTRPMVGRTSHPLRDHLTLRRTTCTEIRVSSARWDLCGGPPVRAVTTATVG